MKVLIPAAEVAPIIKIGGLGDVIGSLPKALEKIGVNADVIVPFFPSAKLENIPLYKNLEISVPFNGKANLVSVFSTKLPGSNVDVLLLSSNEYFASGGTSFFSNNITETEMYSFFNRAVVEYIKSRFNTYDIVHCNDWHTGMITHLLSDELSLERPATIFTIHNLMYQGIGDREILKELGIVPGTHPLIDWDVSDGDINFLQQGITSADYVNAVSPTYAQEILTAEFGGNMCDILQARTARLSGILNGIDYTQFPRDYNTKNWREIKSKHKKELCLVLGLKNYEAPLFAFVGRIDPNQKGMDIMLDVIPDIVKRGGNFVLLGKGLPDWEDKLRKLSEMPKYKDNVSIKIEFDINLANKIYAASDFLVVPSKYEPCGLIQMISMWYGSLPIVHAVGGLKDSVVDGKTGITFTDYSASALLSAIKRGFEVYESKTLHEKMTVLALKQGFSWDKSAVEYKKLYEKAAHGNIHI